MRTRPILAVAAIAAATFAASCAETTAPAPPLHAVARTTFTSGAVAPTLLECPVAQTQRASGLVGLLGGLLQVAGTQVHFPLGAVPLLTEFTAVVPASNHMEISVSASGLGHYLFNQPVTVTIDYSRCPDSVLEKGPLSVWYIDEDTKALLQNMGGVDDRARKRITFTTDHFSGYALAN